MKRIGLAVLGLSGMALLAWQAAPALQNASVSTPKADPVTPAAPKPAAVVAKTVEKMPEGPTSKTTPMADRVAVLGLLNKRNGLSRDLTLKPGQAVRIGDVVVRLQACDTTAPWEVEQLTGSFTQVTVQGADKKWRRVFSGWLYKESPSLNAVEHPIYDVWTKECKMRHMDVGEGVIVAKGGGKDGDGSSSPAPRRRSSAPKSAPRAVAAEPVDDSVDSAEDSLDI